MAKSRNGPDHKKRSRARAQRLKQSATLKRHVAIPSMAALLLLAATTVRTDHSRGR
jgi:hypothetical protein